MRQRLGLCLRWEGIASVGGALVGSAVQGAAGPAALGVEGTRDRDEI